ncbi:3-carboxy-cis,cis-muconate cycloisomerase [Halovulum dunhuangense]|uniref:3-carboxy-cis,cis-muconate cycloisomerase n=1 Tax=Halovulum dunhuangense TaxID=1505036 RepID=A0A849KYZ4_9RHOB|nr:3-carboxy-cis,cis-muconate cycloisomerase [Halovulum dunhuangense]NNU79596.1 3-carboxy-cis,cis-muconate cycloisomerase [Halovulum dunhuangense]
MAVSPFDSPLWSGLYADPELGRLFGDSAEIRAMLMVEGALARVQGDLGLIPQDAAKAIQRGALEVAIDPAALSAGTARAGVPVGALVEAFRKALPDPSVGAWVHWGTTTQDIMDTALVLRLRRVLEIMDARLVTLIAHLADRAEEHRNTPMAARTRHQNATPTTLGAKIAAWGMPLIRHRARLAELRPRLLVVSLGGASGTLSAMQGQGQAVAEGLARALDLGAPEIPWHSTRDGITELAGWAALVTGSLGKMGADLLELGATDLAEVSAGAGGGSSTMPHKRNPVGAETLVQLATANAHAVGAMHSAMLHAQERDGAAWGLEWLTLPQMLCAAGRALSVGADLAATMQADVAAMRRAFDGHQGVMFAESCTFALSAHMPRTDAAALVMAACATALRDNRPLRAVLCDMTDAPVDWAHAFDPLAQAGEAPAFADRFVRAARA